MRIAFIDVTVTVSFGGIQTAVWELAKALHDLQHEVTVFGGEGEIWPNLGERSISIKKHPFTSRDKVLDLGSRFRRLWERWSFSNHFRQEVIDGCFDWVIVTKPFDFFWPWRMDRPTTTRFCFMSGGTDFFIGDRYLSNKIDAWAACSHFNAWQIAHHYKKHPEVIFNGVDINLFFPKTADDAVRAQLGIEKDEIVFSFAGRMVGWKGLHVVIRALAEKVLANCPVKLLLIGDGDARISLEKLAQKLGVSDRVVFQPPVPHHQLPEMYSASDIGVFPSIGDEAFGITIAEAMACGIPVLASHIGGIPEVVGNEGSCGLLLPVGDHKVWAEAMAYLAENYEARRNLGLAAAQRIRNFYTWKHSADRLAHLLENTFPIDRLIPKCMD